MAFQEIIGDDSAEYWLYIKKSGRGSLMVVKFPRFCFVYVNIMKYESLYKYC